MDRIRAKESLEFIQTISAAFPSKERREILTNIVNRAYPDDDDLRARWLLAVTTPE